MSLSIVILGLSITSSWGNGHATTYRGLVRELARRGHSVVFLERDTPWYAAHRDLPDPPYGFTYIYGSLEELRDECAASVARADLVILGSYVPDGIEVAEWVLATARGAVAFYDIDTPVTLSALATGKAEYITAGLIPRFDLYLSFTGGPVLQKLRDRYKARRAHALYCAIDPELYRPEPVAAQWDLGYMGTYSTDRQPVLDRLLLQTARTLPAASFVVAGPLYPGNIAWPQNVERIEHVEPARHADFYCRQRYTLNVTRADMVATGWSPSVRLFEAACCGAAIISDAWAGIESFFRPGEEILLAHSAADVLAALRDMSDEQRLEIGRRARVRVLAAHTSGHRAADLETHALQVLDERVAARA